MAGLLALGLILPRYASAHEGRFTLTGQVTCEGISVWRDQRYQILGRCEGLNYPYSEQIDEYNLWIAPVDATAPVRLGPVDKGIFQGSTNKQFNRIFITAESDGSSRTPSNLTIVDGNVKGFDFGEPTIQKPTSIPTLATSTPVSAAASTNRLSLGAGISRVSLLLFAVVVIVLGIILFRSR